MTLNGEELWTLGEQRVRIVVRSRHLLLVLCLILFPSVAAAHAKMVRSEPQANATLKQVPKTVELWFNEELEHNFSTQ